MRNSYIANSSEALNLHNGTQTAIVVAMKVQPKNTEQTLCTITEGNGSESGKHFWCNLVDYSCTNQTETFSAPYALGQEVYVREKFWSGFELDEKDCVDEDKPLTIYKADTNDPRPFNVSDDWCTHEYGHDKRDWLHWQSPATMPKSAARTRFKIVSCEAVRVKDLKGSQKAFEDFCKQFGIKKIPLSKPYGVNKATHAYSLVDMQGSDEYLYENCLRDYYGAFGHYIAQKLGDKAWDNNDYIWFYKIEKI
jgi:hypothetical protein